MTKKSKSHCAKDGCTLPGFSRGLCRKHYDEARGDKRRSKAGAKKEKNNVKGGVKSKVNEKKEPTKVKAKAAEAPTAAVREDRCAVAGCSQPHHAKGYCKLHYSRLRRGGDPKAAPSDGETPLPRANAAAPAATTGNRRLELIRERYELLRKEADQVREELMADEEDVPPLDRDDS